MEDLSTAIAKALLEIPERTDPESILAKERKRVEKLKPAELLAYKMPEEVRVAMREVALLKARRRHGDDSWHDIAYYLKTLPVVPYMPEEVLL